MTVTFSARRGDSPLQIGSYHGYRIDGDQASIHAELSVPPYHPGGAWALELWASNGPYQGGDLSGVRLSEVLFELPTPLAPHTHRIEATVSAQLPLPGRAYVMMLALVERGNERRVCDVASYPALESFAGPQLQGEVGYEVRGHEVLLLAAGVANARPVGNLSGTLSLELWAWSEGAAAAPEQGVCMAAAQLRPVAGGEQVGALRCRAPLGELPPGSYQLSLLLREWTQALGYQTRDRRDFALPYCVWAGEAPPTRESLESEPVMAEPVVAEPVVAEPVVAEPVVAVPVEVTRPELTPEPEAELDWELPDSVAPLSAPEPPAPEPVAAPPAAAQLTRGARVSLNSGSLDELARMKGLNTKVAKEIVKRRPYTSLEQLIDVRGIGRKTFDKLRSLVTL